MDTSCNWVGSPVARQEAWEKVTGGALYTGDKTLPGCLEAKILRSPYPFARILNIDTSRAAKLPGVRAVITARDLPDRRFGRAIQDQPVLARDVVRFVGERVAAVAADDADTALRAVSLIQVAYEELPAATDPLEAMKPGAPVVHPDLSAYREGARIPRIPNVVDHAVWGIGDLELGFSRAVAVFEHTFRTPVVHQGYLEPHVCLVAIDSDHTVRVFSTNKSPFDLRDKLARLLSLPLSGIEVMYGHIGADFGGKGPLMDEPVCYYLALAAHKPVRSAMTVEEELIAANPRHATIITIKSGVAGDGTLTARHARLILDAGAYAGANVVPVHGSKVLGAYRIPHTRIDGLAVYTNTVPAGHCRAPGDPQAFFAVESHTDMLARAIGTDPLEFRRRNVLGPGDVSPTGLKWQGINALPVLEAAAARAGWDTPRPPGAGLGIALTERPAGPGEAAAAVMLHDDGSATVVSGYTDTGTGSTTVIRQIAATELGINPDRVAVAGGCTATAPYDSGSGASRMTYVTGHAVRLAARDALNETGRLAASQWKVAQDEVAYRSGLFTTPGQEGLSWGDVLAKQGRGKNVVVGRGSFVGRSDDCTGFCAQVAEVRVDPETGGTAVNRIWAVNDIGRAVNPAAAMGQVEGAAVQGLGFALTEELGYAQGQPLARHLADFRPPTCLDAPPVESHLWEEEAGPGPYGAKAIGEHGIAAAAPAIANAVFAAAGARVVDLPITPEKVYRALHGEEGGDGRAL